MGPKLFNKPASGDVCVCGVWDIYVCVWCVVHIYVCVCVYVCVWCVCGALSKRARRWTGHRNVSRN